jgi:AbrB family looped-hinge helix DNA binding protein
LVGLKYIIIPEVIGMYIYESKVGKKFQTVVPMQIREIAGIEEGDSLIWEANEDGSFIVRPQKSKTDYLAGLNQKAYGTFDEAKKHVEKEKSEWDE